MEHDLIISGGKVVDGSGAAPIHADVGVKDGRISRIGDLSADTAARSSGLFHPAPRHVVIRDLLDRARRRFDALPDAALQALLEDAVYHEVFANDWNEETGPEGEEMYLGGDSYGLHIERYRVPPGWHGVEGGQSDNGRDWTGGTVHPVLR